MPKFLKILITMGVVLIMVGTLNLWYDTIIIGGLYYNAPIKAGLSTLIVLAVGYGGFESIRYLFKK